MNRFRPTPGVRFAILVGGLLAGCATRQPAPVTTAGPAVFVEGEIVQQTGSRLSRVVKKGTPAGVTNDMSGGVLGSGVLARVQNDINPQFPTGGR